MQSTSSQARDAVLAALDQQLSGGADAARLAGDLFVLASAIDGEHSLNRILTEPSVPPEAKRTMLRALLEGKVGEPTLRVVDDSVGRRWTRVAGLPDTLEYAAITALAFAAAEAGELDAVEDDLFRFERILEASPELRDALSDAAASVEGKRSLLHDLLQDRVGSSTLALLDQVVLLRHRSIQAGLEYYQQVVAHYRNRLVATVWVAAPLSGDHKERIARALASEYSHDVHLNVIVDPEVLGGVRVAIGDELIDSTIQTRLAQARRRVVR
ncbi:MAG: F0F1 ATP synthase subunit delta [Nocardioidaceae bacterium]